MFILFQMNQSDWAKVRLWITSPFPSPQWRECRHLLCRRWAEFWVFWPGGPTYQTAIFETLRLIFRFWHCGLGAWVLVLLLWERCREGGGPGQNTNFMYSASVAGFSANGFKIGFQYDCDWSAMSLIYGWEPALWLVLSDLNFWIGQEKKLAKANQIKISHYSIIV